MNFATIKTLTADGSFNSANGLLYAFIITFSDGVTGQANAKTNPPKYKVGDQVGYEITGERNGMNKLKVDRKAAEGQPPSGGRDITPPANERPHQNGNGRTYSEEDTGPGIAPTSAGFYDKMKNFGVLYLHCLSTARKVNLSLKTSGLPEMSDAHFQACVSTLFIKADREGLALSPPAVSRAAAPAASAPTGRASAPANKPKAGPDGSVNTDGVDEDVPF